MPAVRISIFIGLFVASLAYTGWRYLLEGFVPYQNTPVYLLNKAMALTSVLSFICLLYCLLRRQMEQLAFWGRATMHTAVLHSIFSISIMSPLYYSHLYDWKRMNWSGELSIFTGVVALYLFFVARPKGSEKNHPLTRLTNLTIAILISCHLWAMGYDGWMRPDLWNGDLIPISLLSFGITLIAVVLSILILFSFDNKEE